MNSTLSKLDIHNGLDVADIHPRQGAKYSPNLYHWLTSRANRKSLSRIYRDQDNLLWIGYPDGYGGLIGQRLIVVLCSGTKANSACWVNLGPLTEVADFWPRYVRDGRCAIDPEHHIAFVGEDTRWSVDGDTRKCVWCGNATQVLRRWTETVDRQSWESA